MRRFTLDSKQITSGIIWLILATGIVLRLRLYGDPRLSIATNDTISYVTSSEAPILSWEIFTGRRVFTTNLVYKLLLPDKEYQIIANGSGDTTRRAYQPGFESIAILQFIISVISWSALILVTTKYINNFALKITGAITLLLFAISPQIAEWDSVLMAESLSISLFVLQFSLLICLIFNSILGTGKLTALLISLWIPVYFFWTFVRDTNLYAIPATILLLLIIWWLMRTPSTKRIIALVSILLCMLAIGWVTSRNSIRPLIEIAHVYKSEILPFPGRVAIFQSWGMPAPNTTPFQAWFEEDGVTYFIKFLITHPGYVATRLGRDTLLVFGESLQPYFRNPELGDARITLVRIGEVLHPSSAMPIFIGIFILIGLIQKGMDRSNVHNLPWMYIGIWFYLVASQTLFVSILAGTFGLYRHSLFSTMAFRLFMWLFLFVVLDQGLDKNRMELEYKQAPKMENVR